MATFESKLTDYSTKQRAEKNARKHNNIPMAAFGHQVIYDTVTINPSAYNVANDQIRLVRLPPNARLLGYSIKTASKFDGGAAASVVDVGLADAAGFVEHIANSTFTQSDNGWVDTESATIALAGGVRGIDAGLKWLTLRTSTPASAAVATSAVITVCVEYTLDGVTLTS